MKILVLESSTTSAKAMLYDTGTRQETVASEPYGCTGESGSAQNAGQIFDKTAAVARKLAVDVCADMILLSTTWHSVLLCGRDGVPVTPVKLWSYTGAAGLCKSIRRDTRFTEWYYRKTGSLVNSTYPYFKLREFRDQGTLNKSLRIGGQGEYMMHRLTGAWVTTRSMASGTGLLDMHTGTYDSLLLDSLEITEEQLPAIVPYGQTFPLSEEGAALLGQHSGTPVVPAYPDGALNQVGAGALSEGIMTFSVGTSAAIRMVTKEFLLPGKPSLWSYLVPPSGHLLGAATSGACNCQDWIKKILFPEKTYADIEQMVSISRNTPVFLPFLFGERSPGWNEDRKGGFEQLLPSHTVFDMYQAVLEGILFNIFHCYDILVKTAGRPSVIKLSGGILYSPVWTQMCADVFGQAITTDNQKQSSLMGCVVIGRQLLGDLDHLTSFRSSPGQIIEPDGAAHVRYMEKYQRYLTYYEKLR